MATSVGIAGPSRQAKWRDRVAIIAMSLLATAIRFWDLGAKALSYDEAATAAMAQPPPWQIILFHWDAAFEHPPIWSLLTHSWIRIAGLSEYSLRLLPAFGGVLLIPVLWSLQKRLAYSWFGWRLVTGLLVVASPVLLQYSQEARMYALVVLLAVTSCYLLVRLVDRFTVFSALFLAVVTTMMLGLHYYSGILVIAQVLYLLLMAVALRQRRRLLPRMALAAAVLGLATLPLVIWMLFAPGFHETLAVVLDSASITPISTGQFLTELWIDLSFGAFRWQPAQASVGVILVPFFVYGAALVLWDSVADVRPVQHGEHWQPWRWLLLLVVLVPILLSAITFRTLATRYVLYVAPVIFAIVAYGLLRFRLVWWTFAAVGLLASLTVSATGDSYYFTTYRKSEYREMASYLNKYIIPEREVVLLEGPRQHLLTRYYVRPDVDAFPVPMVGLTPYWPVTAAPVVPEMLDDRIQTYLRDYDAIWAIYAGEGEVDPGEFLAKYLTAVAFEVDCTSWIDGRLCRYVSPHVVLPEVSLATGVTYANQLELVESSVTLSPTEIEEAAAYLYVHLVWYTLHPPSVDYKVSLKLQDRTGRIIAQHDDYPIGPLLPPTTWQAGDEKPGYATLTVPVDAPAGEYALLLELYDPATLTPLPGLLEDQGTPRRVLATLEIGDTIALAPADGSANPEQPVLVGQ